MFYIFIYYLSYLLLYKNGIPRACGIFLIWLWEFQNSFLFSDFLVVILQKLRKSVQKLNYVSINWKEGVKHLWSVYTT